MKQLFIIFLVFIISVSYSQTAEDYIDKGNSKANLQDYRGAIEDYSKAIQLNPNDSMPYYNRGLSKLELNQKNSACLDWSKAGELGNGNAYDLIKKNCN
jgi:tetratricopeptide (TPR) repeat protein